MTDDNPNRRRAPRFTFDGRVWCDVDDVSRYVRFRNVSLTGAQLETLLPLDIGASTHMRWGAEDETIEVQARVVWTAPASGALAVGVVFEHITTLGPLTKFITHRENDAP